MFHFFGTPCMFQDCYVGCTTYVLFVFWHQETIWRKSFVYSVEALSSPKLLISYLPSLVCDVWIHWGLFWIHWGLLIFYLLQVFRGPMLLWRWLSFVQEMQIQEVQTGINQNWTPIHVLTMMNLGYKCTSTNKSLVWTQPLYFSTTKHCDPQTWNAPTKLDIQRSRPW